MAPTYTYSYDPSTSNKDAVRFLCQDTDVITPGAARLTDEEINWTLASVTNNVLLAAAVCADTIAAYWAKVQNTRIGPLNIQRSQAVTFYQAVAAELRRMASRFAGATTVFYPVGDQRYTNTNNGQGGPQHIFCVGMDDYPTFSQFWPPADTPPLTTYP